jgi:hypothetical protein
VRRKNGGSYFSLSHSSSLAPKTWTQSIRFLISQGVTQFGEMGPGNVLCSGIGESGERFDPGY